MVTTISNVNNGATLWREKRDKLEHRLKLTCYSSQMAEGWQRKEEGEVVRQDTREALGSQGL